MNQRVVGIFLAAQLLGCVVERSVQVTQIVVSIDSDLDPEELRTIRVQVADPADGIVAATRNYTLTYAPPEDGKVALPFSFAIDRGHSDDVRLVVTGFGDAGDGDANEPLVASRVDARFITGESLLLRVLLARACLNMLCDDQTTCEPPSDDGEGARCIAIERAPLSSFVPTRENEWPVRDAEVAREPPEAELDAGEALDAAVADGEAAAPLNLIQNGSFEELDALGGPLHWERIAWHASPGNCAPSVAPQNDMEARACWMRLSDEDASEGTHSVSISIPNSDANDARWQQKVEGLTPGRVYELCGKVRGSVGPESPGASLYYYLFGDQYPTEVWTKTGDFAAWPAQPYCKSFKATTDSVDVGCRIGTYGGIAYGTIWCDELSLRVLP